MAGPISNNPSTVSNTKTARADDNPAHNQRAENNDPNTVVAPPQDTVELSEVGVSLSASNSSSQSEGRLQNYQEAMQLAQDLRTQISNNSEAALAAHGGSAQAATAALVQG